VNFGNPHAGGARLHIETQHAPASGYDVIIEPGVLQRAHELITSTVGPASFCIIAPDDVATLYAQPLRHALAAELITFPAGESSKTIETWQHLSAAMLARGLGRDTCVIALGGGVAGDLAGFVAATYMRGVPVVQVPTTLLAMIDASVGGKTGVDTTAGKNLIGAFHPPALVISDPHVLRTLPDEQLRAGLAEAVKHGAIADAEYFGSIERGADAILRLDESALAQLITRSVEIKANVVSEDPFERGARAMLNFGHTIGHAVEAHAQYSLPHGYAVAIGMVAEAAIGEATGITESGTTDRLRTLLHRLRLPVALHSDVDALMSFMRLDKKARAGTPRFALLQRIGRIAAEGGEWTYAVPEKTIAAALEGLSRTPDFV
jgi:3-dehydroquinate synthase